MTQHPPGTPSQQRRWRRWRPHWELLACGTLGHALAGADAAELRAQDAILAREDPDGTRWHRCLRCDINVAVVVYLLLAKRLFGLRGGVAAEAAESARDLGWAALERTAPGTAGRLGV